MQLVAAVAGGDVDIPHGVANRDRHLVQDRVTLEVTMLVVEPLKVVQVENKAGERASVALSAAAFLLQRVRQVVAVV